MARVYRACFILAKKIIYGYIFNCILGFGEIMTTRLKFLFITSVFLLFSTVVFSGNLSEKKFRTLSKDEISDTAQYLNHYDVFSKYASGYNLEVLKAIDKVQAHAMDGGQYFIGLKADPPESPVNYDLKLGGKSLIAPPRNSSYCSGSTYAAFIETLNDVLPEIAEKLSPERFEAMRMQEPDGGRREDWIKFWGIWNADGFGSEYALVQYGKLGIDIAPEEAMPGDFANISWKSGNGHSVIFLGWHQNAEGKKFILYWSSQKKTNGYGDQLSGLDEIAEIKFSRLTKPENIYNFNVSEKINKKIPGDKINWK
jgi:hypothetical protein